MSEKKPEGSGGGGGPGCFLPMLAAAALGGVLAVALGYDDPQAVAQWAVGGALVVPGLCCAAFAAIMGVAVGLPLVSMFLQRLEDSKRRKAKRDFIDSRRR